MAAKRMAKADFTPDPDQFFCCPCRYTQGYGIYRNNIVTAAKPDGPGF
jgi:hypothetical protein